MLFNQIEELWLLLQQGEHEYYVCHQLSHRNLPGFCAEGNVRSDKLTQPAFMLPVPDMWQQARISHEFFHQSAKVLKKQFNLPISEARATIQASPDCQQITK